MVKDVYYFPHDYEPTGDPKMEALIGKYHASGYGIFWRIVEMLHADSLHKLPLKPYIYMAIANKMHADINLVDELVADCIDVFELFKTDGECFWSERVNRNIEIRIKLSKTRSKSGKLGAEAKKAKANAKQVQANAKQN